MGGLGERLGLLGGTFDPPHVGHLWLAETARDQLHLDRVLFLPVGRPPHKEGETITAVAHRVAMLDLALDGAPHFILDETDCRREPPHTTLTLLPLLRAAHPRAAFWLLVGGDSLRDFPTWHQPQALLQLCRLAVLPRPGASIDWDALETAVPTVRAAVDLLDGPTLDVSSTDIRRWAAAGHSLRHLVAPVVDAYIRAHNLY